MRRFPVPAAAALAVALVATLGVVGTAHRAAPTAAAGIAPVMSCDQLARIDFSGVAGAPTSVQSATVTGEGAGAYCAVRGFIALQTNFELRLPLSTWEGRYLQLGCGGSCGNVGFAVPNRPDLDFALTANTFAVASGNAGHVSTGSKDVWAAGGIDNPLRHQYGYLAQHANAVVSKEIIETFYGRRPAYSYFAGTSAGGRMAVMEAQRYPDDFDGILAAAATVNFAHSQMEWMWHLQHGLDANDVAIIDATAAGVLHRAALAACDGLDGVVDGQLSDPRPCRFDPRTIQCGPSSGTGCLSPAQVAAARAIYDGPKDRAGRRLAIGGQAYGSELAWPSWLAAGLSLGVSQGRFLAFPYDPGADWSYRDFTFTARTFADLQRMAPVYNPVDAKGRFDLTSFRRSGGKIMLWQGWADEAIKPYALLNWYQDIRDAAGGTRRAREFARVFMVPGVAHTSGGSYLPYQMSALPALVDWVERGVAPDRLDARITDAGGTVTRSYPVFAYPTVARYVGPGSPLDAANWVGVAPARDPDDHYPWLGASRQGEHGR